MKIDVTLNDIQTGDRSYFRSPVCNAVSRKIGGSRWVSSIGAILRIDRTKVFSMPPHMVEWDERWMDGEPVEPVSFDLPDGLVSEVAR